MLFKGHFVTFLAFLTTGALTCPQQEFIYPCECRPRSTMDSAIHVVCQQVNATSRLRHAFNTLETYNVGRLLLKDCHLNEINVGGLFQGMKINVLRLMDSTLRGPTTGSRPLSGLAGHLQRLDLTSCGGLLSIPNLGMGSLRGVHTLNVQRDVIPTLTSAMMPNPSDLSHIRLEQCQIERLAQGALAHITSLVALTINKNRLTEIRRDSLPGDCTPLVSIDFSENQLASLPAGFFDAMPNLHTVNLYNNQLKSIEQSTWSHVWPRLERLWINENPLCCNRSVEWIYSRLPSVLQGACEIPENLRGTPLIELSIEMLKP